MRSIDAVSTEHAGKLTEQTRRLVVSAGASIRSQYSDVLQLLLTSRNV